MHKGMLEVVEMFRNRDKEGLKMYLQKFLPHMDDETIEAFIVGDAVDAAGQGKYGLDNIQGQLIRLGSGRDYAGKIEMVKNAENMRALDKLDVTDRKPNAFRWHSNYVRGRIMDIEAILEKYEDRLQSKLQGPWTTEHVQSQGQEVNPMFESRQGFCYFKK